MAELTDSFDAVVDADLWEQAAAVGAGYMEASLAQSLGEGVWPFDLPNELYGVGVAYAGHTFAPMYETEIAARGVVTGLHQIPKWSDRPSERSERGSPDARPEAGHPAFWSRFFKGRFAKERSD